MPADVDAVEDALVGTLTLQGESGAVRGTYDAGTKTLDLEVAGPDVARGSWRLQASNDRLRGQVTTAGSSDLVSVSLVRVPTR